MDNILFTPASIIDLLSKIEELSDKDIAISETLNGSLELQVGHSVYEILEDSVNVIEAESETVEEIEDVIEETYEELCDCDELDNIEGGIVKEVAKTLLIGGLVRLTKRLLT